MVSPTQSSALAPKPISVTTNANLRRIMEHEFGQGANFDTKPLYDYLKELTPQQVQVLMSYPYQKYFLKHRLVVFVTLDSRVSGPLGADQCDAASTPSSANATFAVFHCDGVLTQVTLICLTKEFNLNAGRPLLHPPSTAAPLVYKVSAMNMTGISGEGDVIWHRVSRRLGTSNYGEAIYGGTPSKAPNSLHGMINTQGCWMLFRNYNWYAPKFGEFMEIYRHFRKGSSEAVVAGELRAKGYVENDDWKLVNERFLGYDRNYAYTWFTRHVVGIDYVSHNRLSNSFNIDGKVLAPVFAGTAPAAGSLNAHDWSAAGAGFKFGPSQWTTNACGFKTATDFTPFAGKVVGRLEETSWADLYCFKR